MDAERMPVVEARAARIPALGLGTWRMKGETCRSAVRAALELGYRHIDTARMYENEADVGRALRESPVARDDLFVATKLWMDELDEAGVRRATESSLERLKTGWIDLLLVHWPSDEVPLEETLGAMHALRERGLVKHVGVSNFPAEHVRRALESEPDLVCDQVEYHPFLGQERLKAALRERGIALVAYGPLAQGRVATDPELRSVAEELGATPAQVALRWLLAQPGVAAIPKAASHEHLEANLGALELELPERARKRIDALARGERFIDPDFAPAWDAG